jgi:hypothetical protein
MACEYFFTFGIITPKDSILVGALLLASLSLSDAMYLLLELDMPYQGLIAISNKPRISAMKQL